VSPAQHLTEASLSLWRAAEEPRLGLAYRAHLSHAATALMRAGECRLAVRVRRIRDGRGAAFCGIWALREAVKARAAEFAASEWRAA